MKRREFVSKGLAGMAALPLAALHASPSTAKQISLEAKLTGHEADRTFVGSNDWTQDGEGILYSPIWNQCIVRKEGDDLLQREDFVYPTSEDLSETDVSVEFQTFAAYWSFDNVAVVLRAQDSVRFYCAQIAELGSDEAQYEVRIFVQDGSGYRRDIASTHVFHGRIRGGPRPVLGSPQSWENFTPGWMKVRAQARGESIRVSFNDKPVLEIRDSTYSVGRAGIVVRGPNKLRNLVVSGTRSRLAPAWREIDKRPSYFHPWPDPQKQFGDNQTRPGIFRTAEGDLVIWVGVQGDPHFPQDILLVRSRDEGGKWGDPVLVKKLGDGGIPGFFCGLGGGRISCLYTYDWKTTKRAFSSNGGRTWSEPEALVVGGKALDAYAGDGGIGAYSPIWRLADGTLLQTYFHLQGKIGQDGSPGEHRSLVIRSTDNGETWTGPHYLDPRNFESNDCMVIQRGDGALLAFSRALHDRLMWVNESRDNGLTWTKQVPSTCPRVDHHFMIRHSSGVLLMASRGEGVFVNTSTDEGKTWSRGTRISPCSGNTVMTELEGGRVLVVFHEGYRRPTRIRGHFMQVAKDGTLTPA